MLRPRDGAGADDARSADLLLPRLPPAGEEERLPPQALDELALVDGAEQVPQDALRLGRGRGRLRARQRGRRAVVDDDHVVAVPSREERCFMRRRQAEGVLDVDAANAAGGGRGEGQYESPSGSETARRGTHPSRRMMGSRHTVSALTCPCSYSSRERRSRRRTRGPSPVSALVDCK